MSGPVVICVGTRPEVIKMAPVYRALGETALEPVVLHTGQHDASTDPARRTVWPLYEFFGLRPAYRLDLVRASDSLAHLTAMLMEQLDELFGYLTPQAVLVQGDTASSFVAALAAFYRRIPVGHVEAGLRTHQDYDPFPEEKNRQLIARLARWHFTPTPEASSNLRREGIPDRAVREVGNTVVDALEWAVKQVDLRVASDQEVLPAMLQALPARLDGRRLLLVTAHRRENWGARIAQIAQAVRSLLAGDPGLVVVWSVHPNPKVHATVESAFEGLEAGAAERLHLTPGLDYPCVVWLLRRAWLVLTDSGGIQEECAALGTPVLILRDHTERMEVVAAGGGMLVGTDPEAITGQVTRLERDPVRYAAMRGAPNPFGDGRASQRIAAVIAAALGADEPAGAHAPGRPGYAR